MDFHPVTSSTVHSVAHAPDGTLHVKFHSGRHYAYAAVPPDVHQALVSSASVGGAIHKLLKGSYEARRVS